MSVEEKLLGIAAGALFLGIFFVMFLIIFRNTNYPCIEDEEEKEKGK